ncbi:MAG: phage integrase N-terminal SAM-like domain-containing protein [Fidelibacterota bacterium]
MYFLVTMTTEFINIAIQSSHTSKHQTVWNSPKQHRKMQKPKLMDLVHEAIRSRHYSRRTEQAYCRWIIQFARFNGVCLSGVVKRYHIYS